MTREELFRAVGEVREDLIEDVEPLKKQRRLWKRLAALAACLALIVTAAAVPWMNRAQPNWNLILYNFNPEVVRDIEGAADAGSGDLDGSSYWTDNPARPTHPDYSADVEIGELSGPGNNPGMMGLDADVPWLTPEELFAQDTVIFRGTVRELQYFQVAMGFLNKGSIDIKVYYTRALVEITDAIRGDLTEGETYSLLWLGARGYMTTSLIGPLEDLDVGSDAIFMPIRTDQNTGWKEGNSYFCYADLAEYYLPEGMRYVFADTSESLDFERSAYPALETAETLEEVAAYIREVTGETERTQRAVVGEEPMEPGGYVFVEGTGDRANTPPEREAIVPQTGPGDAAQATETSPSEGPMGALEFSGGTIAGNEKSGVSP